MSIGFKNIKKLKFDCACTLEIFCNGKEKLHLTSLNHKMDLSFGADHATQNRQETVQMLDVLLIRSSTRAQPCGAWASEGEAHLSTPLSHYPHQVGLWHTKNGFKYVQNATFGMKAKEQEREKMTENQRRDGQRRQLL